MKTAAVVIDSWKLDIFSNALKDAGYQFEVLGGITKDTLTLKVNYEWVAKLQPIIENANRRCANAKRH